jgi:hypothetical protein
MDYIRNWRRYHAEVDALAQVGNSNHDISPQSSETAEGDATENCNAREISGHDDTVDNSFDGHYSGSDNDYELQNIDDDQYMYDSFSESNDSYVTYTDEDSENDNEAHVPDLAADLVGWATNNECTRSGLNDLLDILRKQGHRLPKDSRTLFQTPRSIYTIK